MNRFDELSGCVDQWIIERLFEDSNALSNRLTH